MASRSPRVFWWLVGTVGGALLLFVGVWLLIGWRYASGEPTPGLPHLARLEALVPVVEIEDAARPRLLEALDAMEPYFAYDLGDWARMDREPLETWETDTPVEVERWLGVAAHRALLSHLVGVPLDHPRFGDPGPVNLVYITYEDGSDPRLEAAMAIEAEAARTIAAGEGEAAQRAIRSLLNLANMADERPLLPQFEERVEMERTVLHQLGRGLAARVWSDATLQILDGTLSSVDPCDRLMSVLGGEALLAAAVRAGAYTDNGNGDGRLTPAATNVMYEANAEYVLTELLTDDGNPGMTSTRRWDLLGGPLILRWAPGRAEAREACRSLLAAAAALLERPAPGDESEAAGFLATASASLGKGHVARVASRLDPNARLKRKLFAVVRDTLLLEAEVAAARVALAAERFRLACGRFPAAVAELREAGFAGFADRGVAGPFRLAVRGDRLLVYTDGADGDDDGGRSADPEDPEDPMAVFPPLTPFPSPPDGDVVLFGG